MFKVQVTFGAMKKSLKAVHSSQDAKGLAVDVANRVMRATAKELVLYYVECIWRQQKPDGSPQKRNSQFWFEDKAGRNVNPNIPLHNEGYLINPQRWRIWHDGAWKVDVLPPSNRVDVVRDLQRRGYGVYTLPPPPVVERLFKQALNRLTGGDEAKLWLAGFID